MTEFSFQQSTQSRSSLFLLEEIKINGDHSVVAGSMHFSASNITNSAEANCPDVGPAWYGAERINETFRSAGCIDFYIF